MRKRLVLCAGVLVSAAFGSVAAAGQGQSLQIVVSIDKQRLNVYDGDQLVTSSKISSGKPGHDTPTGIFSVLEKQKFHRSNKYSNAPMPWMQRITWSGVALHESNSVPNRPASHGCVRMPGEFAQALYRMTERGAHVIITDQMVAPTKLSGSALLKPSQSPFSPSFMDDVAMRPGLQAAGKDNVEVAMNDTPKTASLASHEEEKRTPVYILITRADNSHLMFDIQTGLNRLGYDVGTVDGQSGSLTKAAIAKFRTDNALSSGQTVDDAFVEALFKKAGIPAPQNGQLIIRQNFAEIYRAPVTIENPQAALGTHFMEARNVDPRTQVAEWYGITLSNRIPDGAKKRLGITSDADLTDPDGIVHALERVAMSDETRLKVSQTLGEGSSLTITDVESKSETGLGTNFVTLTTPVEN